MGSDCSFCKKQQNPWNLVFETFNTINALKESRDTFLEADAREHCVLDYRRQVLQDHHCRSSQQTITAVLRILIRLLCRSSDSDLTRTGWNSGQGSFAPAWVISPTKISRSIRSRGKIAKSRELLSVVEANEGIFQARRKFKISPPLCKF